VRVQPTPSVRMGLEVHWVVTSVAAVLRRHFFSSYSSAVLSREVERVVESHAKNAPRESAHT